ncbi:MAG: amidohydrolase family protein [Chloroflexota bacterium]|nr:amidohydrolase family protein [Chloroflexota bacterium]MDQ5864525.1 amidohydrolase family protein [Chloroflexota bacterium]
MIIDFHTHVFPDEVRANREEFLEREAWFGTLYADPKHKLASAEDVVASMEAAGVDRTVVLGFPWRDGGLCSEHNSYILDAVQRYPDKLIGFAIVQPLAAGDAKELDRCLNGGLMGLGEVGPDSQRYDIEAKWVLADSVEVLLHHDRPLLTHSSEPLGHDYAGKGTITPPRLLKLASNFPDLKIVLAHWGGGLPFYELMPEVRETLRNVYYDSAASTYLYNFDIFPIAAQLVGTERILWGTDFPLLSQAKFLKRVRSSGLSDEQLAAVLGGNAARLLRL